MTECGGKAVLLTGAAGGPGAAATLAFAERRARVIAIDIDEAKIAALENRAGQVSQGVVQIERMDLAYPDRVRTRVSELADQAGGIDVLINNAAIYPSKAFAQYSLAEWDLVQRVNMTAAVACLQGVLPTMRRRPSGRIINVASTTYYGGWALPAPYVASKGAMVALTRAREFGVDGITSNCIAPGAFPTDAEKIHPDPEGRSRFVLEHQSIKGRGHPEDIATAMLLFTSDRSGFITGQMLNVDGGRVMQ